MPARVARRWVAKMEVPVSAAKTTLTELVRRAEAGEDVVLTRHGRPVVRLAPVHARLDSAQRRALLEAVVASASAHAVAGPDAARSQDFLYGEDGMPQ